MLSEELQQIETGHRRRQKRTADFGIVCGLLPNSPNPGLVNQSLGITEESYRFTISSTAQTQTHTHTHTHPNAKHTEQFGTMHSKILV